MTTLWATLVNRIASERASPPQPQDQHCGDQRQEESEKKNDARPLNVEPTTADLAAPETAPADAGAKSAKPAQRKSAMDAYAAQTDREHKPAQRRPRPRLNHNAWAHQRPNFPSFGLSGW